MTARPLREIRAEYDAETITVYQAYAPAIAGPAVAAQGFVPPFSRGRMTWVKPSFLWMMYRCGWATKPGQERVLAVRLSRSGFDEALAEAALSTLDPQVHASHDEWRHGLDTSPVRVQWDPERDLRLDRLPYRSLQLGLSGSAAERYVDEWTITIRDVTELARSVHTLVGQGELEAAALRLPTERPYPVTEQTRRRLGMPDA